MLAFGGGFAFAILCRQMGGNVQVYTRWDDYYPELSPGNVTCDPNAGSTCYECVTWSKPNKEWFYCAENEGGTWGNGDGYTDWWELPWIEPERI